MPNFLQITPFFRITLALVWGIVGANFGVPLWFFRYFAAFSLLVFIVFSFFKLKNELVKGRVLGLFVCALIFNFGGFLWFEKQEKSAFSHENSQGIFLVKLLENPIEKEKTVMCKVEVLAKKDSAKIENAFGKAIIYFEKDSAVKNLNISDKIVLKTRFSMPETDKNPLAFDYAKYLKTKGFGTTGYVKKTHWEKVGRDENFSFFYYAENFRKKLLKIYTDYGISGDEFAVLAALTLGYKDALTPELRESFSTTGAMHVLAVSGLHVGIIYFVLSWLLLPLKKGRKKLILRNVLIILTLWAYAFITGLSPSVMRATLMFSLVAVAEIFHRKSVIFNTIFLSAFIILLINPNLIFDVGFQLSYSAVLAIVYFQPRLSGIWTPKNRISKWCWDLACVSVVAQIGTAPLAIYYFNQFPNYFLLTNFVVIPAASVIIYSAIALFATSQISFLGGVVALWLKWFLSLICKTISIIENFSHSLTKLWISEWQLVLLYLIIICFAIYFERSTFRSLVLALGGIFMFFVLRFVAHYQDFSEQKVVVFSSKKANVLNFISGRENIVVTSDSLEAKRLAQTFWLKTRAPKPIFISDETLKNTAFVANNRRFVTITKNFPRRKYPKNTLEIDDLVIARKMYVDSTLFVKYFNTNNVIATQNVPKTTKRYIKKFAPQMSD